MYKPTQKNGWQKIGWIDWEFKHKSTHNFICKYYNTQKLEILIFKLRGKRTKSGKIEIKKK